MPGIPLRRSCKSVFCSSQWGSASTVAFWTHPRRRDRDSIALRTAADEALSLTGHRLYIEVLQRMRDEVGLAFLQPGRFLMPSPGAQPPWMQFFPLPGRSPLAKLMQARFSAYVNAVRGDLM